MAIDLGQLLNVGQGQGADINANPDFAKFAEIVQKLLEALTGSPEDVEEFIKNVAQETPAPSPEEVGGAKIEQLLQPGQGQPGTAGGRERPSLVPDPRPKEALPPGTIEENPQEREPSLAERLAQIGKSIEVPTAETIPPQAPPRPIAPQGAAAFSGGGGQDLINALLIAAQQQGSGLPTLGELIRRGTPGSGAT